MTDKLHDPKTQGPEGRHPARYQDDLNSNAAAGQNFALIVPKSEVHHEHWDRLIGVTTPERIGEA